MKEQIKRWVHENFDEFAEIIGEVLSDKVQLKWYQDVPYKRWFKKWQDQGVTILPNHYYSPIPHLSQLLKANLERRFSLHGIDMQDSEQLRLLNNLSQYKNEYSEFSSRTTPRIDGKYFLGGAYPRIDAELTYALVRHLRPKRIIEIGSGFSTLIISEACIANKSENKPCNFTSIDPYPNDLFKMNIAGLTEHLAKPVEKLSVDYFSSLSEGDILFIDSTHIIKPGNDVDVEYFDIIPSLQVGVNVHVHDIFLPKPYPANWIQEEHIFWNEQYLLAAFLSYNETFKTVLAPSYLCEKFPDRVKDVIPNIDLTKMLPGSFWFKRIK